MKSELNTALEKVGQTGDPLVMVLEQICSEIHEIHEQLLGQRKDFYTVEEVAAMTGRQPYTVRRWITEKKITATRVQGTGPRGRLLVAHDQIARLIDAGLGTNIPNTVVK